MTGLEIAELTGKTVGNVKRDIEVVLDGLGIDRIKFEFTYKDAVGRNQANYNLDKDLTLTLVSGYDVKARYAISAHWNSVEQQKPLTQLEMMQVMITKQIEQEKINAQIPGLQNDIAEIKEKIEHNEHIFHRGDYTSIKAYCNTNKVNIDGRVSAAVGRACTKACGTQGLKVKKLPCPYFGEVNSYPVWIIEEVLLTMGLLE